MCGNITDAQTHSTVMRDLTQLQNTSGFINYDGNGGSNSILINDSNNGTYPWVDTVATNTVRLQQLSLSIDFNVNFQNISTLTLWCGFGDDSVTLLGGPNQINVNAL